jgi:TIR domain
MKAFLSHASVDNLLAKRIFNFLRDQPVAVWFDRLELRPGDLLLDRINAGINAADYLIALITVNSIGSSWVQRELEIALADEKSAGKPVLVPLIVRPCAPPAILDGRVYLSIDEGQTEFSDIVPALFRSSFILDVALSPDLHVDKQALVNDLYDLIRSPMSSLRVRIYNNGLNKKIKEIAEHTIAEMTKEGGHDSFVEQVRESAQMYDIHLPLFWTTLADLLTQLCECIFGETGRNLEGLDFAQNAISNAVDLAMHKLASRSRLDTFSTFAKDVGYPEVDAWVASLGMHSDDDSWVRLVTRLAGPQFARSLTEVALQGAKERGVRNTRCLAPVPEPWILNSRPRPGAELLTHPWFELCLPQIIARELSIIVFYEGRPIHELAYKVGLGLDDYVSMGPT